MLSEASDKRLELRPPRQETNMIDLWYYWDAYGLLSQRVYVRVAEYTEDGGVRFTHSCFQEGCSFFVFRMRDHEMFLQSRTANRFILMIWKIIPIAFDIRVSP